MEKILEYIEIEQLFYNIRFVFDNNKLRIRSLENSSALLENTPCVKYLGDGPQFLFKLHDSNERELSLVRDETNQLWNAMRSLEEKKNEKRMELENYALKLPKFELLRGEVLEFFSCIDTVEYFVFSATMTKRNGQKRYIQHREKIERP